MGYIGRTPTGSILTSADIADGSISTAKLADDAVDNTKLDLADTYAFTGTVSGTKGLINIAQNTSNTRTALSNSASYTFMSFSYNQQKANSKIRVDVVLWGFGEAAGATNIKIGYNSTFYSGFANMVYIAGSYIKPVYGHIYIDGASSTGNKTIQIIHESENGAAARPFLTWNPNATDDARLGQTTSYVIVTEYDL